MITNKDKIKSKNRILEVSLYAVLCMILLISNKPNSLAIMSLSNLDSSFVISQNSDDKKSSEVKKSSVINKRYLSSGLNDNTFAVAIQSVIGLTISICVTALVFAYARGRRTYNVILENVVLIE